MLIDAIIETQDTTPDSLAALLFELMRRESAQHEARVIDRSPALRQAILANVHTTAQGLMPTVTDAQWRQAQQVLARRL